MYAIVYRQGSSKGQRSPLFPKTFPTRAEALGALYRVYPAADAAWPKLDIVVT